MNKLEVKFAIGIGAAVIVCLVVLVIVEMVKSPRDLSLEYTVAPDGYIEQNISYTDAALDSIAGVVILPSERDIRVHGHMKGGMPELMKILQERSVGLTYIYKKYLKIRPGFEGSLSMDFTVDVCGDVTSKVEISSSTGFPRFNQEIINTLGRQKFPTTEQGRYTLSFTLKFSKE